MKVRAVAKDVGISPQKLQLVTNMVRGRKVDEALTILGFLPTPTALAVGVGKKPRIVNAENNFQMSPAELTITAIFADQGRILKRFRPQSRGRVSPILKRSSNITVFVEVEE